VSTSVIFARMKKEDIQLLKKVCEARGEDLSDFVRRSVKMELARLSYLNEEEKKALGMLKNDN
jgi:uncharacterized protein (DUF1778 family)